MHSSTTAGELNTLQQLVQVKKIDFSVLKTEGTCIDLLGKIFTPVEKEQLAKSFHVLYARDVMPLTKQENIALLMIAGVVKVWLVTDNWPKRDIETLNTHELANLYKSFNLNDDDLNQIVYHLIMAKMPKLVLGLQEYFKTRIDPNFQYNSITLACAAASQHFWRVLQQFWENKQLVNLDDQTKKGTTIAGLLLTNSQWNLFINLFPQSKSFNFLREKINIFISGRNHLVPILIVLLLKPHSVSQKSVFEFLIFRESKPSFFHYIDLNIQVDDQRSRFYGITLALLLVFGKKWDVLQGVASNSFRYLLCERAVNPDSELSRMNCLVNIDVSAFYTENKNRLYQLLYQRAAPLELISFLISANARLGLDFYSAENFTPEYLGILKDLFCSGEPHIVEPIFDSMVEVSGYHVPQKTLEISSIKNYPFMTIVADYRIRKKISSDVFNLVMDVGRHGQHELFLAFIKKHVRLDEINWKETSNLLKKFLYFSDHQLFKRILQGLPNAIKMIKEENKHFNDYIVDCLVAIFHHFKNDNAVCLSNALENLALLVQEREPYVDSSSLIKSKNFCYEYACRHFFEIKSANCFGAIFKLWEFFCGLKEENRRVDFIGCSIVWDKNENTWIVDKLDKVMFQLAADAERRHGYYFEKIAYQSLIQLIIKQESFVVDLECCKFAEYNSKSSLELLWAKNPHWEFAEWIANKKINLFLPAKTTTPLHVAVTAYRLGTVEKLIQNGAGVDAKDERYRKPSDLGFALEIKLFCFIKVNKELKDRFGDRTSAKISWFGTNVVIEAAVVHLALANTLREFIFNKENSSLPRLTQNDFQYMIYEPTLNEIVTALKNSPIYRPYLPPIFFGHDTLRKKV